MRFRPVVLVVVLAMVAVGGIIAWRTKSNVRIDVGAVAFEIDPINGDVSISADPLAFVKKLVRVEIGAEIEPGEGDQTIIIRTAQETNWAATLPADGSWTAVVGNVVGDVGIQVDGGRRRTLVDLRQAYVESLEVRRTDGESGWDTDPEVDRLETHPVVVDTSLLDSGDFGYCDGNCALYLHNIAAFAPSTRVLTEQGDPVVIPNGARVEAICEAGGEDVFNDRGETSDVWEYIVYEGRVGYVPALWTGTATAPVVRVCGT